MAGSVSAKDFFAKQARNELAWQKPYVRQPMTDEQRLHKNEATRMYRSSISTRRTPQERFEEKTRLESNGCITWLANVTPNGYGTFHFEGRTVAAHRAAWFFEHGEWPPAMETGMVLHHTCGNPACVNIYHLQVVTREANLAFAREHSQTRSTRPKKNQHCDCCAEYRYDKQSKAYVRKDVE